MQKQKSKILIVDDERDLCEILQFNLEGEGFITEVAYSAEEALTKDLSSFDLILLDVMMEKMSGFKFAEKIRKELSLKIPIIFITAKTTENDLLTGFSLGGDDYIPKPFSIKVVIARVKALLKRGIVNTPETSNIISVGNLVIDIDKRSLNIDDKTILLTKKEFEILVLLINGSGKIFSREEIINKAWEDNTYVTNRTIDVHITRLRKKIGNYSQFLKSKSGYGYTFEKPTNI